MKGTARPRQRRALSAPGGNIRTDGEPAAAKTLADALRRGTGELSAEERALPHGFHSYPARFHPRLVRTLLEGVPPGATLLDPFCGSGTTLVEGALAGLTGKGVDVNPLAIELARLKVSVCPPRARTKLVEEAQRISTASLARVKALTRTKTRGNQYDDPKFYAPYIFRELVGLREELEGADPSVRPMLLMCFSSIVVKVSKQPSDTAAGEVERSIGKGMPSRMLLRRAEELSRQLAAYADKVPAGTPRPDIRLGDARKLDHIAKGSIDLIITSPPYLGTYDYTEQHARRFGWIGLNSKAMDKAEIGSRRRARPEDALDLWQKDVDAFMAEMARVLRGRAYVVIGDSAVGSRAIAGDLAVRKSAEQLGLKVVASASQDRPSFYAGVGETVRREHLLQLQSTKI